MTECADDHGGHPGHGGRGRRVQERAGDSDKENARVEADNALQRAVFGVMNDDTQHFSDDPDFRQWLGRTVFGLVYDQAG